MKIDIEKAKIHAKIMEHLQKYFKDYGMLSKDDFLGMIIQSGKEIKEEKDNE